MLRGFPSTFADKLAVSIAFLDVELFLILFFPSDKVGVLEHDGVGRPSTRATSFAATREANTSISLASSLLTMPFSNLEDSCGMGFLGVNSKDGFSFDGHIPFRCPFGVPFLRFLCKQKLHLYTMLF